ncbi:SDR family NAD(P)-dependent oxidoreductase [Streptomyces viridochromogenes]|uniref:SDR family NAD(P)-dependent oxidoreductase n=1 Tax=Streptomyces viridochromogenes TaxID=1938 RepID=UPI000AF0A664
MKLSKSCNDLRLLSSGPRAGLGEINLPPVQAGSHFRREGANLLLTGRRPELRESHPDDLHLAGDLNDEAFASELAARAADHLGDVGVVVLCHGLQKSGPLAETTADDARDLLHSNLLSAFLVMKHLMPLAPEPGASMVCVSSRLGMVGMPNQTLYSAAKGGLIALARGAAIEWAPRSIRVNVGGPATGRRGRPDGFRPGAGWGRPGRRAAWRDLGRCRAVPGARTWRARPHA